MIPIPNFIPSYNIGLPGAIREAHQALGYGGRPSFGGGAMPLTLAANEGAAPTEASVLAQFQAGNVPLPNGARTRSPQPLGYGAGGLGGGSQADFDSLIDLIMSTIEPDSWADVGGPGSIEVLRPTSAWS